MGSGMGPSQSGPGPPLAEPGRRLTAVTVAAVLVDEGVEDAQGELVPGPGLLVSRAFGFECAGDGHGVVGPPVGEPQPAVVVGPDQREAQLLDGQPEVLDLFHSEPRPRRHGGRSEPGQDDQVGLDRDGQLDDVAAGRRGHASVAAHRRASSTEPQMVKTSVRPVISNTFRILGSAITSRRSPPASRQRFSAPTSTPNAVESRKVTSSRLTAMVELPEATRACRRSRNCGAVATSTSPATDTTATEPPPSSVISKVWSMSCHSSRYTPVRYTPVLGTWWCSLILQPLLRAPRGMGSTR